MELLLPCRARAARATYGGATSPSARRRARVRRRAGAARAARRSPCCGRPARRRAPPGDRFGPSCATRSARSRTSGTGATRHAGPSREWAAAHDTGARAPPGAARRPRARAPRLERDDAPAVRARGRRARVPRARVAPRGRQGAPHLRRRRPLRFYNVTVGCSPRAGAALAARGRRRRGGAAPHAEATRTRPADRARVRRRVGRDGRAQSRGSRAVRLREGALRARRHDKRGRATALRWLSAVPRRGELGISTRAT